MSVKAASSSQDLNQSRTRSSKILSHRFTDVDQVSEFSSYLSSVTLGYFHEFPSLQPT